MADERKFSLVNIEGRAAEALIKESPAILRFLFPRRIVRVAQAKAEAGIISTEADIEIEDLKRRAAHRRQAEDLRDQKNLEQIAGFARPLLAPGATADQIDDDWMTNLRDKARLVSNEQMQTMWARLLAGEMNQPGSFLKRTVNSMADLDRTDCELFTKLCCFCLCFEDAKPPDPEFLPFVDLRQPIYRDNGINFDSLTHLDSIGLINFGVQGHFVRENVMGCISIRYFDTTLYVEIPEGGNTNLDIGSVMFTQVGGELARIAGGTSLPGFLDYVRARWAHLLKAAP